MIMHIVIYIYILEIIMKKLNALMGGLVSFLKNKAVDPGVLRPGDHIYCNRFSRFYIHHHHGDYLLV